MSPPIHPLTSSQGAVFLINSCQAYFCCSPHHAKRDDGNFEYLISNLEKYSTKNNKRKKRNGRTFWLPFLFFFRHFSKFELRTSIFPITLRVMGAGLIPKLRPLFCRVPWRPLIRSPCSTRADYLCRFTVRSSRV